jgi:hypothetical protein
MNFFKTALLLAARSECRRGTAWRAAEMSGVADAPA